MITFCRECVLHENSPGVSLHADGVCSECRPQGKSLPPWPSTAMINTMEELFRSVKGKGYVYDALVCFSGGKDSTALLYKMKYVYGLNVLAFSVVNPFVNQHAIANMRSTAKKLAVDVHMLTVPKELFNQYLRDGLVQGEAVGNGADLYGCNLCGYLVRALACRVAFGMDIPIFMDGGEYVQTGEPVLVRGEELYQMSQRTDTRMSKLGKLYLTTFQGFLKEIDRSLEHSRGRARSLTGLPTFVVPFTIIPYDHAGIFQELERFDIHFRDHSPLHTNCTAHHVFAYIALKKYNVHPFERNIARGIRLHRSSVLTQLSDQARSSGTLPDRDTIKAFLQEYQRLLNWIVEQRPVLSPEVVDRLYSSSAPSQRIFSRGDFGIFIDQMSGVNGHIQELQLGPVIPAPV